MLNDFTRFRRTQIAEMTPWAPGFDMTRVSVSLPDGEAGSPMTGDMIARNPKNRADMWLVAAQYFADNFEALEKAPPLPDREEIARLIRNAMMPESNKQKHWTLFYKAADAVRDAILALREPGEGVAEPRAWRWRHGGGKWTYGDDRPAGPSAHLFEVEALYVDAAPPRAGAEAATEPFGWYSTYRAPDHDDFTRDPALADDWRGQEQALIPLYTSPPAQADGKRSPLRKFVNEVSGIWSAYEHDLRNVMGNTNYACVERRLDEADKVLSQEAPDAGVVDPSCRSAKNLTDAELVSELKSVEAKWDDLRKNCDGMSGSPGEWMVERMDEIDAEQKRRAALPDPAKAGTTDGGRK